MFKRRLLTSLGVVALAGSSVALAGSATAQPARHAAARPASAAPFVVGVDWDSTSASAAYTDVTERTLQLAITLLNHSGGVLGHQIKLVFANDESDPTKTPAVVEQLANEGAKFIFMNEGVSYAGKPEIQKLGIPTIGPTDVVPLLASPPDNTYGWLVASQLSGWDAVYCGAFHKLGYKTIAILRDDSATTEGLDDILFPPLEKCVKVVDVETAPGDSTNLTPYVARIQAKSPDAVLVADLGGPFEILAQDELHAVMPSTPRWSLATIVNEPSTWKLAPKGDLAGIVSMGSLNPNNPQTKKLDAILKAHYGSSYQMSVFDANAWDAVQLMKDAMIRAGGDDPAKVNAALAENHSFLASFGQPGYTLTYSTTKHSGANGLCGLVLEEFTASNTPSEAFPGYQPPGCG
ncbi:MAG TPA: ABC transporter substrate-binding protein [Acidimicrobiales bacterium]|nr:ABC transporter substrate-binding protein [Acidimicrobiales bacterium]